jgi:hypothetical protein
MKRLKVADERKRRTCANRIEPGSECWKDRQLKEFERERFGLRGCTGRETFPQSGDPQLGREAANLLESG